MKSSNTIRAGILGGGQLGRMLLQAAANYPVITYVMENDENCPAAHLCHHFMKGDITNYNDVYNFGKNVDVLTIEIESVNEDALQQLENEGVKIYPKPSVIKTIRNKILQKQFYKQHSIPSADFIVTHSHEQLVAAIDFLPAVHKISTGGYDGKGVQILESEKDIHKAFSQPSVLEKMIKIEKEIAQIIAVNERGETVLYPAVEMIFDPYFNLLDYQLCPADLPEKILWKVEAVSLSVVKALKSPGIFAIELFVDKNGEVFVNETAPRVHNSGHHTIEANYSSQFDMLWRVLLNYPLGNANNILPAAIVNLIGENGYKGNAIYEGLNEVLAMENVFLHIYGKQETKPGRKMGHATILHKDKQELIFRAKRIKQLLKIKGEEEIVF